MGVQDLLFKARLDGIDRVIPQESMRWFLQVRCARCGELNDKDIYFTFTETVEKSGTPGIFNFVMRCKFCTNQSTIKMLSLVPYSQTENCQRVAQCEVRGLQIVS